MTMGGNKGVTWPYGGASDVAASFDHEMNTACRVNDIVSDSRNKIVSTPAYMQGNAKPHEVFDGMSKFV